MQSDESISSKYDVILIDAFTGDGIPTHLLTREAIEIYLSHLSKNGVIVFHVSNRYYDLRPVLKAITVELKLLGAVQYSDQSKLKRYQYSSTYVALTRSSGRLEPLLKYGWKKFEKGDGLKVTKAWTDDHINIIRSLMGDWGWLAGEWKQRLEIYRAKYLN
jgi:spermidine synthase